MTIGHHRITIGHYFFSISKHQANTTELHPKVRQTCSFFKYLLYVVARFMANAVFSQCVLHQNQPLRADVNERVSWINYQTLLLTKNQLEKLEAAKPV